MKQYTAAGGAATAFSFQLNFCPEFLLFNAGANQLTSIKVEDQGKGIILDLDTAGINACKNPMFIGTKANATLLVLADGVILDRNITISGVTSAAGAVDFYTFGDNRGVSFIKTTKAAVLANNPTDFNKFQMLFMPSLAAGDRAYTDFNDGHSQILDRDEIEQMSGHYQNVVAYVLNNVQAYIKNVKLIVATQQTVYQVSVLTN